MKIEQICSSDYNSIISNLNEWWGGRNMTDMLPRLFFKHFNETSFIIKHEESVLGFLIGFISQTNKQQAYIHFIGVNPEFRKKGIGRMLYEHFFQVVTKNKVQVVECLTSLLNKPSIKFHTKIGFQIQSGDSMSEDGISYFKDYDGEGEDRVLFKANTSLEIGATFRN